MSHTNNVTKQASFLRKLWWTSLFLFIALPAMALVLSKTWYYEVPDEGQTVLNADLELALGKILIGKAEIGYLFQGEVLLESENLRPSFDFETSGSAGELDLSLEGKDDRGLSVDGLSSVRRSEWEVNFGTETPLVLDLELGAAKCDLNLTGIPVQLVNIEAGATDVKLRFLEENPIAMESLELSAKVGNLKAIGLGNSRARSFFFEGSVGKFHLDFTGNNRSLLGVNADFSISKAVATIVLPNDTPIVIDIPPSWHTSIEMPAGFRKKANGRWYSSSVRPQSDAFVLMVDASFANIIFKNADR